ncbi:MAG: FAD binding domain-containing protein [Treponema sp.]|jgi:CO/xanthine dehydrogenase FAD-binding subunit|nr:FAD binding domain-containing protein [Treponema sp.]
MAAPRNLVFRPAAFSELFSAWSRFPDAVPFAGGTALIRSAGGGTPGVLGPGGNRELPELPRNILSLERIEELQRVTRTERYLEIGAMVKLNGVIALGKTVPAALTSAIKGVAGPQLRNLATIGGNILISGDCAAPMAALDARYELRGAAGSRWIAAPRFPSLFFGREEGKETSAPRELLTRIRVPLDQWTRVVYRKFLPEDSRGEGGVLIILIRNQKDVLTHIQVAFVLTPPRGASLFRDKDSETFLAGKALPLDRKDAIHYGALWNTYLTGRGKPGLPLRAKIVNVIEESVLGLAD